MWLSVSVGDHHSCAVKEDRTAWCWGGFTILSVHVSVGVFANSVRLLLRDFVHCTLSDCHNEFDRSCLQA
jgi:hypothetical protein